MILDTKIIDKIPSDKIGYFRFKKFDAHTYLITNDA